MTTFNLRLFESSPSVLDQAVANGWLRPVNERYAGLAGAQVYTFADPEESVLPYDPFGMHIFGHLHQTNAFVLPAAEYGAFIAQQPQFAAWNIERLIELLHNPATPPAKLTEELCRTVEADKSREQHVNTSDYRAVWLPQASRLCCDSGGWTLVLAFETSTTLQPQLHRRSCHGIDVGMAPLATVANGRGESWQAAGLARFHSSGTPEGDDRQLHLMGRVWHMAVYKASQRRFEALISRLICEANSVIVEDLTLQELRKRLGHGLDDRAVIDFLYALLPQRLHQARIPLVRHPAAYTSRMCSRCYGYALRRLQTWSRLQCANCGEEHDANEDAARVLVQVGSYHALERLRRALGGTPHEHHRAL